MKSLVFVLASLTLTNALLNPYAFVSQNVDELLMSNGGENANRFKRDADSSSSETPRPSLGVCARSCKRHFERALASSVHHDLFNRTEVSNVNNPKLVGGMCSKHNVFKRLSTCLQECGTDPEINMITKMITLMDFVCVERHTDFVQYDECVWNARTLVSRTCIDQCGNDNRTLERIIATINSGRDVSQIMNGMGQMCTSVTCHLACVTPALTESCGTDDAAELYTALTGRVMDVLRYVLEQMNMAELMPDTCAQLANTADNNDVSN